MEDIDVYCMSTSSKIRQIVIRVKVNNRNYDTVLYHDSSVLHTTTTLPPMHPPSSTKFYYHTSDIINRGLIRQR